MSKLSLDFGELFSHSNSTPGLPVTSNRVKEGGLPDKLTKNKEDLSKSGLTGLPGLITRNLSWMKKNQVSLLYNLDRGQTESHTTDI